MDIDSLPQNLRLDKTRPKNFSEVKSDLQGPPRYKVTAKGSDSYDRNYRIIHSYYIAVAANDPSNVRKLMSSMGVSEIKVWEDGRSQDSICGFSFLTPTRKLENFRKALLSATEKLPGSYVVVAYHNLVQFSQIGENIVVYPSLPVDF